MKMINLKRSILFFITFFLGISSVVAQDEDFNKLAEMIFKKDTEGIKSLVQSGIDVDIRNSSGATPLILASSLSDNMSVIECLVDLGADVNARGKVDGSTPLMWAARGSKEATEFFLSKGAEVNVVASDGSTALIKAIFGIFRGGSLETVDLLIKAGADVNLTGSEGDGNGYAGISYAARNGKAELVSYLIDKGADVNHQTIDGDTPLMISAEEGYTEIVKILINANADRSLKNNEGKKAIDIAMEKDNQDIVKLLR
jgi:uncharacterized protein